MTTQEEVSKFETVPSQVSSSSDRGVGLRGFESHPPHHFTSARGEIFSPLKSNPPPVATPDSKYLPTFGGAGYSLAGLRE